MREGKEGQRGRESVAREKKLEGRLKEVSKGKGRGQQGGE